MKKSIFSLILLALASTNIQAQDNNEQFKYRRSSLYSVLVNHTDQKFADEIKSAFIAMPTPDKYNDHDLSVKVINLDKKLKGAKSDEENSTISTFLTENQVASRLVAKWFDRDFYTGQCNMNLVMERGLYNATKFDAILAEKSERSQALMADAGEELIGNTFVLVNDIRYIDKQQRAKVAGGILRALGSIADAAMGTNSFSNMADNLADITESLKGFRVKINTFLYRLDWNDDVALNFYKNQYSANANDTTKYNAFEQGRGNYHLTYVGKCESSGSTTSFMGIKLDEPVQMVRKACQRALDENVVALQRAHSEFRTKSPLVTTEPITAYVGMKEGVTEKSEFEVLEIIEAEDGSISYERVGVIQPIKNMIWDNRYMASEEGAIGSSLGATTFKRISGSKEFYPGMVIREITK